MCLSILLLIFQVRVFGFNPSCFKKTKTIAICLTIAFNVVLIVDLIRYPDISFAGSSAILALLFIFKYTAIVGLSHYFINRSGDLIKKKERV